MLVAMLHDGLTRVYEGDWQEHTATCQFYAGKYQVGRFKIENAFIVEYMMMVHEIEIPTCWLLHEGDINEEKVTFMESSDILTKTLMHEIRETIKKPPMNIHLYRSENRIVKIEIKGLL